MYLEINSNLTTRLLVNGGILDGKYWQVSVISPPGFGKFFGKLVVPITDT
jgi:hypothetical protein